MKWLRALERFWYEPMPPARLGWVRASVGAYALWYLWTRRDTLAEIARGSLDLFEPVGVFRVLNYPMDPVAFDWLVWITLASGTLFTIGWLHRWAGPVFGVSLLVTLCYRNSWSMVYHMHNSLVLHALVLGFTRSADGFSVDARLRACRGMPPRDASSDHGWPIRLICATTLATYFLSGYAKMVGPQGMSWARGTLMREQIAVDNLRKELLEGGGMQLAYEFWGHAWLFGVLGVLALVLEIGAPLVMFSSRASRTWAILTWLMHWGIFVIMGIRFRYQLAFVAFLPFFVSGRPRGARTLETEGAAVR